jgi:hypothetical protein
MSNLKARIERLEQHQGTKEDDYHMVGPLGRLEYDSIEEWQLACKIIDAEYQRIKAGEIEQNEQTDDALCARILEAISQSKQITVPGERLAMA